MGDVRPPLDALQTQLTALVGEWEGALPPFGVVDGGPATVLGQMSDRGLYAVVTAAASLARKVDALTTAVYAEVARRSPREAGVEGFARRFGFASPGRLAAAATGGHFGRVMAQVAVGEEVAERIALTGEPLPPLRAYLAAAFHAGQVSVDAAHLIVGMLNRVAHCTDIAVLERAERDLTDYARTFTLDELKIIVGRMAATLDPDGLEPRESEQFARRSLTLREDAKGMIHIRGVLDPVTGAPIKAALEAYVTAHERTARGHNHPGNPASPAGATTSLADPAEPASTVPDESAPTDRDESASADPATTAGGAVDGAGGAVDGAAVTDSPGPVPVEIRSEAQMRADALSAFARHALGCESRVPGLPIITMVVRVDLEDLLGALGAAGFATVDGKSQPISAAAARQLAAGATLIPAVMGGPSLPLDLGRATRHFTKAQLLALWERDGGCALCGQTRWVEAHHVAWWVRDHGPTDIGNAVLLCCHCHHRVHREGWRIHITPDDARVWFIPPPTVDPAQQPRPGHTFHRRRAA